MSEAEREERISHAFEIQEEAEEEKWRFRDFSPEDMAAFFVFWVLAADVFVQFFTRYVLNDSFGWTEEVARYLLIGTCFIGSIGAVRNNSHIMVEFCYRFIPGLTARVLSFLIDVSRIAFFAAFSWISFEIAGKTREMMASIDFPKSIMYYIVSACFLFMAARGVQVLIRHWRQGGSDMAIGAVERQRQLAAKEMLS